MINTRFQKSGAATLFAVSIALFPCLAGGPAGLQKGSPVSTIPVSSGPVWLRQTFRIQHLPDENDRLFVHTDGTVSVYVNGQRLARSKELNDEAAAWTIGRLLRKGDNSVVLSVAPRIGARSSLAVWLEGAKLPDLPAKAWKKTSVAPPVGWQKTDFNDRDWKAAENGVSIEKRKLIANGIRTEPGIVDDGSSRWQNDGLSFRDNDHVVLLGGTFIERAQSFGFLEAELTAATGDHHVTFRNLGWSADTVFAESRGIFDAPAKGYQRMIEHIRAEEPTVVLLCYGQNEAMSFAEGKSGRDRFANQLMKLCEDIRTTGAEVILISPHPFVDVSKKFPGPSRWNKRIEEFCSVIESVATRLDAPFVNLFSGFVHDLTVVGAESAGVALLSELSDHPDLSRAQQKSWTDNGMHWNSAGYATVGVVVARRISGQTTSRPVVTINPESRAVTAQGGKLRMISWSANRVEFGFRPKTISQIPTNVRLDETAGDVKIQHVHVRHSAGSQTFPASTRVADTKSQTFAANRFDFEELRRLIVRKNELYFHRWRPQNITYLFGFRKHEQGNNASEIAQFDPLISELEQRIHKAKQPQWQSFTVTLQKNPK